jgi:hypothetical protein
MPTGLAGRLIERLGFKPVLTVQSDAGTHLPDEPATTVSLDWIKASVATARWRSRPYLSKGRARLDARLRELELADATPIPESYLQLLLATARDTSSAGALAQHQVSARTSWSAGWPRGWNTDSILNAITGGGENARPRWFDSAVWSRISAK